MNDPSPDVAHILRHRLVVDVPDHLGLDEGSMVSFGTEDGALAGLCSSVILKPGRDL